MNKISTIKDKAVKEVVALTKDKNFRHECGLFVIEGVRMVRDALSFGVALQNIFVDKSNSDLVGEFGESAVLTEGYIIDKMSATQSPQGILATVKIIPRKLSAPKCHAVILDGVQDPGNAGSIMRTALAAGITDIYFVNSVDPYNPKVVKSSMSAIFHQNIYICKNPSEVAEVMGKSGTELLCADMKGENIFSISKKDKFALVIGNEGSGASDFFLKNSCRVAVPMDSRVESLNAAASAAILIYTLQNKI